jgi:hypothetical protein
VLASALGANEMAIPFSGILQNPVCIPLIPVLLKGNLGKINI